MTEPVLAAYRGVVCDLDGVVYRGTTALPHAVASLREAAARVGVVFATNNASRTPATVAGQLHDLGLPGATVLTSAQAGAALLAREFAPGTSVLAVGGAGIDAALTEVGLIAVRGRGAESAAVAALLQGWDPNVRVADLGAAAISVAAGALWVATNTDRTLPTADGLVPGNGTLVAAVAAATGVEPIIVGKPHPPLYRMAAARLGLPAGDILAIGDRLDTDIGGAARAGLDSLWILGGVDGFRSLASQSVDPTYAAADLRVLARPAVPVSSTGRAWQTSLVRVDIGEDQQPQILAARQAAPADADGLIAHVIAAGTRAVVALREDGSPGQRAAAMADALDRWLADRSIPGPAQ